MRGPTDSELSCYILSGTPDAVSVTVLRNEHDSGGSQWVRVDCRDGSTHEWGYEYPNRWVWPWRDYFDASGPDT
jgi:hypothetical protein